MKDLCELVALDAVTLSHTNNQAYTPKHFNITGKQAVWSMSEGLQCVPAAFTYS